MQGWMCFFGDNPESVGVRHTYNTAHVFSHFCLPALIAVSSRTSKRAFTTQSSSQDTSFSLLFIQTHLLPSVQYFNKSECCGMWPGSLGSTGGKKTKNEQQQPLTNTVAPRVPVYTHHHLLLSYKSKQIGVFIHPSADFLPSAGQTRQGRFVWIGSFELNKRLLVDCSV